jgi:hypothetical protein
MDAVAETALFAITITIRSDLHVMIVAVAEKRRIFVDFRDGNGSRFLNRNAPSTHRLSKCLVFRATLSVMHLTHRGTLGTRAGFQVRSLRCMVWAHPWIDPSF